MDEEEEEEDDAEVDAGCVAHEGRNERPAAAANTRVHAFTHCAIVTCSARTEV